MLSCRNTDPSHADFCNLELAVKQIGEVAQVASVSTPYYVLSFHRTHCRLPTLLCLLSLSIQLLQKVFNSSPDCALLSFILLLYKMLDDKMEEAEGFKEVLTLDDRLFYPCEDVRKQLQLRVKQVCVNDNRRRISFSLFPLSTLIMSF